MNLTDAQQKAVHTESSGVLVIAGAGSGKTRVLTERIAYLLTEKGVSPSELMVLTFTNRAAAEMTERLFASLSAHGWSDPQKECRNMLIGTFHAVAFQMLRQDGDKLGYNVHSLTVIEPADADLLLEQCATDLGYYRGGTWRGGVTLKALRTFLEGLYTTGELPRDKSHALAGPVARKTPDQSLTQIVTEYRSRLFSLNALDFGHILLQCGNLLRKEKKVRQHYDERIKHVLVDEIQDANAIQHYGFLDFFWEPHQTFFAVGDVRQSIYGFRGSRPDLMTKIHLGATTIYLAECFRCGDHIVGAANDLIAKTGEFYAAPMIGATGRPGSVDLCHGRSADIAGLVAGLHKEGYAWRDIAVMARKHRALRRLAGVFADFKLPHRRVGARLDLCNTDEFRLLHAALRLCVNDRDNLAFLRIAPALGLSATDYAEVRRCAAEAGISHYCAYDFTAADWFEQSERDANPLWNAIEVISKEEWPIETAVDVLQDCLGDYGRSGTLDAATIVAACEFWLPCMSMSVSAALRWFALRDAQDDLPDDDVVTLCTVHAAKGLEWPACIVVDLNERDFPGVKSAKSTEELEEERRVCYVALTRTKERLLLHYRRAEDQAAPKGRSAIKPPSRFLTECGAMQ